MIRARNKVKPKTIYNCRRHRGILPVNGDGDGDDTEPDNSEPASQQTRTTINASRGPTQAELARFPNPNYSDKNRDVGHSVTAKFDGYTPVFLSS